MCSQLLLQHPLPLSRQGASTSQICEEEEDRGGGKGCVLCRGARGLSESDNHRGGLLGETPETAALPEHPAWSECQGGGEPAAGRSGELPSAGQTCAFSAAWDNPGPLGLGTVTVLTWPPQCS